MTIEIGVSLAATVAIIGVSLLYLVRRRRDATRRRRPLLFTALNLAALGDSSAVAYLLGLAGGTIARRSRERARRNNEHRT